MKLKRTFDFISIKAVFVFHQKTIIYASIIGLLCAVAVTLYTDPVYEANGYIRLTTEKNLINSIYAAIGQDANVKQLQGTYAETLKSHLVIDPLIEKIAKELPEKYKKIDYKEFTKKISVTPLKDTELIKITGRSDNQKDAATFTNLLLNGFYQTMSDYQRKNRTVIREFIGKLVEDNNKKMNEYAKTLVEFETSKQTLDFAEEYKLFAKNQMDLNGEIDRSVNQVAEYVSKLGSINNSLSYGTMVRVGDNPVLLQYRTNLISVENEIAQLREQYTEKFPQLKSLIALRDEIREKIDREEARIASGEALSTNPLHTPLLQEKFATEADLAGENAKLESLNSRSKLYELAMKKLPKLQLEFNQKQADYHKYVELNKLLTQKYQEAQIDEAATKVDFDIMGNAIADDLPISPNKTFNLIGGLMLGFIFGVSWAFLREVFDPVIRKKEDIPVLMSIPLLAVNKYYLNKHGRLYRLLDKLGLFNKIRHRMELAPKTGELQTVESKVLTQIQKEIQNKTVAVVSFDTNRNIEFAANLAEIAAKSGERTLIIDCDYVNSSLDKIYGVKNIGFVDLLQVDDDPGKYVVRTSIEDLYILPSGVVTDVKRITAVLNNFRTVETLFDRISKLADRIIIVLPRMITGAERVSFLQSAGMMIVTTEVNCTKVLHALMCLDEISKHSQCPIGAVLYEKG
ncbi:MAG: Wzz/FepE/Etk N-terminal domain-containing protein [Negativicutes bacterium]|jgi:uncharacterized protein involved in exopolysaccharide biosynthesis/Mrp family chromosome partitioning ATPase